VIARIWKGTVAAADADAYADYLARTGVAAYAATAGNQGVYVLRRTTDAGCEYVLLSLWTSMDAVRAFAGDDPDRAVFYPEDDRYLVDRDLTVQHLEVAAHRAPDA
jgi:heme-degrading monooxygenase HmoA